MSTQADLAKACAAEVGRATPCAPFPEIPTPIPIKHMTGTSFPERLPGSGLPSVQNQVCLPELLSLLARVAAFQNKAFPNQTLAGKLKHLVKEAGELRDCNGLDREEWADVLLLLLGAAALEGHTFADLVRFAHEKLTINEGRTWLPADADGCYHHVKG